MQIHFQVQIHYIQLLKLRTYNTDTLSIALARNQATNHVRNTALYVQSNEWHGSKILQQGNPLNNLLVIPKPNLKSYGDRSVQVAALPNSIR